MNILEGISYKILKDKNLNLDNSNFSGLETDSRKIQENFIFIAIEGYTVDGHNFIDEAVKNGAKLIIVSKIIELKNDVSYILIENIKEQIAFIASNFYEYPQNKIKMIGITGTNGKTTSSYMIEKLLGEENCARFGTIEYKIGNEIIKAPNTTPEASELIKLISMAYEKKLKYVVMEVSSHALDLGRVNGICFDYAMFTNLTQDHMDYHKNMENYYQAKKKLFYKLKSKDNAVINIDDLYGKRLFNELNSENILTYGMNNGLLQIKNINNNFILSYKNIDYKIEPKVIGDFNIYNILGSIGIALKIGVNIEDIISKIEILKPAPGRFEPVIEGQNFHVIVDYAHTPDALENVLKTALKIKKHKLITVFGCGGDRDATKRPLMAKIAEKYSDIIILTSDNPRTEEPLKILNEVKDGFEKNNHFIIVDRKEAIKKAIELASKYDIVLIAGKGHEDYQILGNKKIHFDDREVAREFLHRS